MRPRLFLTVVLVGLLASLGWSPLPAAAQSPQADLQQALQRLDAWLGQGTDAAGWRAHLHLDALQAELNRGVLPDRKLLTQSLAAWSAAPAGLEAWPFVRFRNALVEALVASPPPPREALPETVRAAKEVFLPRTPTDVADAKQALQAAITALQERIAIAGPEGAGWTQYVRLADLQEQLARPEEPDLKELDKIHALLSAGHEGLGLKWFANVRKTLGQYLATARVVNKPELRGRYQELMDKLAGRLEAYLKEPTAEHALGIKLSLDWLRGAGQARWVAAAVAADLNAPNLVVGFSKPLVDAQVSRPVDDVTVVHDTILGTSLTATAHTVGHLTAELTPCDNQGLVDLVFAGTIAAESVGYHGPVRVCAASATAISARKRIILDGDQVRAQPTVSAAALNSTIRAIESLNGRALIERFAWRRADKQKADADYIAARRTEQRFNARMDQQADKSIADASEMMLQKYRRPLENRAALPKLFRFSTTADALTLTAEQGGENSLTAPAAAPELPGACDLGIRVHQSAINNLTEQTLAGMIVDEKRFQEINTQFLNLPPRVASKEEQNWSITFARPQPVAVRFGDNALSVTIRGQAYTEGDNAYSAMDVTARYKLVRRGQEFLALRQGKLEIFPPGFNPQGNEQLSARQQVLRDMLQRRMERFFDVEWKVQNIVLKGQEGQQTTLTLDHWSCGAGWMIMGWKIVANTPTKLAAGL